MGRTDKIWTHPLYQHYRRFLDRSAIREFNMKSTNQLVSVTNPLATINLWLNLAYTLTMLALAVELGLSLRVILLLSILLALRLFHHRACRGETHHTLVAKTLLYGELPALVALSYGAQPEWLPMVFMVLTGIVMVNYPPFFALPYVYIGYHLYLLLFAPPITSLYTYFLSVISFTVLPVSLFGIRVLIEQRQSILELNQRIQSQAELSAEMTKLRERNNLAEAMHDTIGHTLTASIVSLDGVSLLLEKRPDEAIALLDSVREQLQNGLGDIRQTVRALKTDTLAEHATLQESMQELVGRVSRQTPVTIDLHYQIESELVPIQEYVLYSVVREGITNALKHGEVSEIHILLEQSAHQSVSLTVQDNGKGSHRIEPGFGLTHLEQKVKALGGTMAIETEAMAGFRIQVELPLTLDNSLRHVGKL